MKGTRVKNLMLLATIMVGASSCSYIDEDLSDCDTPAEKQAEVDYDLQLVTNMTTELQTELTTQTDLVLANTLRTYLSDIFTDFAHDVDLSFYDTQGDSARLHHDQHIMDANQASYTLNLPMRHYMHLAVANVVDNPIVGLANDEYCHPSMLQQTSRDTIDSHTTGLFTARLPMNVLEGVDQHFDVHLYMANCAACLVLDPREHDTEDIEVYSTGFATGFSICDSTFLYPKQSPIVRTHPIVPKEDCPEIGFCSISFPSREPIINTPARKDTRTVIETEKPFIAQEGDETLWEMHVYVPQKETASSRGKRKFTRSILRLRRPLRAGQLIIIRGWLAHDGSVETKDVSVGVSVTLDWMPGGTYNPEL